MYIATFTAVSTVTILRFGRLQKKVKSGAEQVNEWWVHKRQLSNLETQHTVLEQQQQEKKLVHTEYNDLLLSSVSSESSVKAKASGTTSSSKAATVNVAAATKMGSNSTDTGDADDDFDAFVISTESYDDDEKEMDAKRELISVEEQNRMDRFVTDFHSMEHRAGFEEGSGHTALSRQQNSTSSSPSSSSLVQQDEPKKLLNSRGQSIVLERSDSNILGP